MARSGNKENTAADAALKHAVGGPLAAGLQAAGPTSPAMDAPAKARKRPIAEVDGGLCAEQLAGKAKVAIRRRCAEMGIRKYASLSSMSARHACAADRKCEATCAPAHKRAGAPARPSALGGRGSGGKTEPSSEATVIVLSSDECECEDEDEDEDKDENEDENEDANEGANVEESERNRDKADGKDECKSAGKAVSGPAAADDVLLESQLTVVAPSSPVRLLGHAECFSDAALDYEDVGASAWTAAAQHDACETYTELSDWLRGVEQRHGLGLGLELGLSRHPELSGRMRPILVDWLMEVAADYRMHRQTLQLAVQYLDRFLASTELQVRPSMLQCYGTACLSIAMKAEEQRAPSLTELTDFSKDAFSRDQLKQAELDVLVALGWHLAVPTVFEFLCLMFQRAALLLPERFADPAAAACKRLPRPCAATTPRRFDPRQLTAACDYADALLHFQGSLRHRASVLAAACFYLGTAPNSLDGPMFAQCTGYAFPEVWPAVLQAKRLRAALDPAAAATLLRVRPCCEDSTRYASHLKRIRPAELWAYQPHHVHLLDEFERHFASR